MSADKDIDNCRECGHFRFLHTDTTGSKGKVFSQMCAPQTDGGCDCKEYVPEDNLGYIEYLAKQKGLV